LQMLLDFGLTPSEYASSDVEYPVISQCPMCGAEKRLIGHGYYYRSVVLRLYDHLRLKIKRLLCTPSGLDKRLQRLTEHDQAQDLASA